MKGLFAATAAVALLAGIPAWAQTAAAPRTLSSQDQTFLKEAGGGNLAEVQLGRLAERQATDPAVQEFGRWMATDHSMAGKRLAAIARFVGHPEQPTLTPQDIALKNRLQALRGPQFDRQYIRAMVMDHRKDIQAFRRQAQDGRAQPLKMYARNMLPVLDQHLAEAEQLAGTGGVATGTTARPAATSGSSIGHYNR
jgi:putative membrane protein